MTISEPQANIDIVDDRKKMASPFRLLLLAIVRLLNSLSDSVDALATSLTTKGIYLEHTSPSLDFYDTDGTANQRKYSLQTLSQSLRLVSLLDNDTVNKVVWQVIASNGQVLFGNSIGVGNMAGNTNTPSGATAYAWPVYDEAGALKGYVPVYGAAW